jgi:hypothetical protein
VEGLGNGLPASCRRSGPIYGRIEVGPLWNLSQKSPKSAKRWKTAEELGQLLAERADVPVYKVSVFGSPENWEATLIAALTGSAERKARFRSIASDLRREFDLKAI